MAQKELIEIYVINEFTVRCYRDKRRVTVIDFVSYSNFLLYFAPKSKRNEIFGSIEYSIHAFSSLFVFQSIGVILIWIFYDIVKGWVTTLSNAYFRIAMVCKAYFGIFMHILIWLIDTRENAFFSCGWKESSLKRNSYDFSKFIFFLSDTFSSIKVPR